MGSVQEETDNLVDKLTGLHIDSSKIITIRVEDKELTCRADVLRNKSKYFEAFLNFDDSESVISLKGGIQEDACQAIIDYFNGEELRINLQNFQDILLGGIFLQSQEIENKSVAFISQQLGQENAFRVLQLSKEVGSKHLLNTAIYYIDTVFSVLLSHATISGKTEEFLEIPVETLENALDMDLQCPEDLLCFATLGWIEHKSSSRLSLAANLLKKINLFLISRSSLQFILEDIDLNDELKDFKENITECLQSDAQSSPSHRQRQSSRWGGGRRWPKMVVASTTGNLKGKIFYLDLRSSKPQHWKLLTNKPAELRQNSTGSSMVYLHPRIYFLGGEKSVRVSWYDVERDEWGESLGMPPPRLLAGTAALEDRLFLIGGVNVEEWERGAIEVVTSTSVDCYQPSTSTWSPLTPLPQGVSNPTVGVYKGQVFIFGGLKRRRIIRSCFRYAETGWEELPPLPDDFCYPALVVDEERDRILLAGGMDANYVTRVETYFYHPGEKLWRTGPNLNRHRKSGFGFECNGDIYVCGGSADGLKHVDATEILKFKSDCWEILRTSAKNWQSTVTCVKTKLPLRLLT